MEAARGTDQEISAVIDQEGGGLVPQDEVSFQEISAWMGVARHAVKSAEFR